jgi:CheY-like chemotaxis protein
MRILVVDDDRAVMETLCALLTGLGHEVVGVTNGLTALERFRRASYDLVIVDLVMPQMNGLEVLRRLRTISHETRLVAITGKLLEVSDVLASAGIPLVSKPILTSADAGALVEAR